MLGPLSVWMRRFAPPWTIESIPGGFKVLDADGQSLADGAGARAQFYNN